MKLRTDRIERICIVALLSWGVSHAASGRVLYLNHFDDDLDADHSLYGEPVGTVRGLGLSGAGTGFPFEGIEGGRALDAGYSAGGDPDAGVMYPAANFDSLRGTIELWVKPGWDANRAQSGMDPVYHRFVSAPIGAKGFVSLYYGYYHGPHWIPHLMFHFNDGTPLVKGEPGPDYIVNARLTPDERKTGLIWKKDRWYYIAATWTPAGMQLFVDGKRVAERTWDEPMDVPPLSGPVTVGNHFTGGQPADALIDELRIADSVLFEAKEEIPVPKGHLAAELDAKTLEAGGFVTLKAPDVRQYTCYTVDTPPEVDGDLSDGVWAKLPAWSGFLVYAKVDEYRTAQTEVKLCRDGENVYVGMTLHEYLFDKLKANVGSEEDNPRVFGDDVAELFFGATHGELPNAQIGINSRNGWCDLWHGKGKADINWSSGFTSATGRSDDGWTLEMTFPYAALGDAPAIGDVWGFRAARSRNTRGTELCPLNYANTGYQNPQQFARLIMAGKIPEIGIAEQENLLNRDFLGDAREKLARFTDEAAGQLGFAGGMSAEAKQKHGIDALEADIDTFTEEIRKLLNETEPAPVARWNRLLLKLESGAGQLDRMAYLLATTMGEAVPPPADFTGIGRKGNSWFVASDRIAAAIDPSTGRIAGLWDREKEMRLMVGSYLRYAWQTRGDEGKFDERTDNVVSAREVDGSLVFTCTNPAMPGLTIRKRYFLEHTGEEQRILCRRIETTADPGEMTLFTITSRSLFDEAFRAPAHYHRMIVIGTMGNLGHVFLPAAEVTANLQQRAWFASDEGRAQFALINPDSGTGLAEYLYKENDRWTFPQALPSSHWTPFGWDMGVAGRFLKERGHSTEVRFHLFSGDAFTYHAEYRALPEFAAIRAELPPHPKARRLGGMASANVGQTVGDSAHAAAYRERIAGKKTQALFRPDELFYSAWTPTDRRWMEFPAADGLEQIDPHHNREGVVKSRRKCADVKKARALFRELSPNLLANSYEFIVDIYKGGPVFEAHPEWAAIKRDGAPKEGFYGDQYVRANWSPAFVDHLVAGLLRTVRYYDLDFCYLDFGVGAILPDWGRGEVVDFETYLPFIRDLKATLNAEGRMLWLNSNVGQPYFDVGYFETFKSQPGHNWRNTASHAAFFKFYQPPGAVILPLYWMGGDMFIERKKWNETGYIDKVIGAAVMPVNCYLDPYHEHFPTEEGEADWSEIWRYQIAVHWTCNEIHESEWVDIGLEPAWWRDPACTLEAYTHRLPRRAEHGGSADGTAYLVNVINHEATETDAEIHVDLDKMGFDPGKRAFIWQLLRRDYEDYPKGVPVPENWDQMFSDRSCSSLVPGGTELSYTIPRLPPERVCVTAISQTPAGFISIAGIPVQTLVPTTLESRITGEVDEDHKRVVLEVSANHDSEIIAWWPVDWGEATVRIDDEEVKGTPALFGNEQFVRFPVTKGTSAVVVKPRHF